MKRIIFHWTAGSYNVNETDKEHYHFIIDGNGKVHAGDLAPEANISTSDNDGYAAHTKNCNTGAIGVSVACMAGAIESPFSPGPYPMKKIQWDQMIVQGAYLCDKYNIPVTPETTLTHAEVEPVLGIKQAGKWDITVLPFDLTVKGHKAVGDKLRREIQALMSKVSTPEATTYVTRSQLADMFKEFADVILKGG